LAIVVSGKTNAGDWLPDETALEVIAETGSLLLTTKSVTHELLKRNPKAVRNHATNQDMSSPFYFEQPSATLWSVTHPADLVSETELNCYSRFSTVPVI
jgi:hypothetical protein